MSTSSLSNIMAFVHDAEGLKMLLRHSWLSNGRQESVAEHTWRMALMAIVLNDQLEEKVDLGHALKMIIVHDLAEVVAGDHHAWKEKLANKFEIEEAGLKKIVADLPSQTAQEILNLWYEFEDCQTPEAKFGQAMDKLEVVIQHNEADLSTWNEREMTFNMVHGGDKVEYSPKLKAFRKIATDESEQKVNKTKKK